MLDRFGSAANVTQNTGITLSLATGTGTLGGTVHRNDHPRCTSTATITGVTYNTAESGVSITATRTSGDVLVAATSATFTVATRVASKPFHQHHLPLREWARPSM